MGLNNSEQFKYKEAMIELKRIEPKARCTYFPMEDQFQIWVDMEPLTNMYYSSLLAIATGISKLKQRKKYEQLS